MLRIAASVSRLHIVAIAGLGTLTFGWAFTGQRPWALAAVACLDWFCVNLLNRVVDVPEDRANQVRGTDWVARRRRPLLVVGLALLVGSLVVVHLWRPALTPLRVAFHALGLAYNWPLLPGGRRIKQLYLWKNTASATGFMLTVFGFPLAVGQPLADVGLATILLAGAFFFLFELSYEVIYDLRDVAGDALAGVNSYAVVHGVRGATRIVDGLLLGSLGVVVAGYVVGALPWRIAVMGSAPVLQWVLYKRHVRRGIGGDDCIRLTWIGAGLLAAYHGWVALELPGV